MNEDETESPLEALSQGRAPPSVSNEEQNSDARNETTNQTTVVIIQTPSSITANLNSRDQLNSVILGHNSDTILAEVESSVEETDNSQTYRFDLQSDNSLDDIRQIHRFLRTNVDNSIATAATIALYNRRLADETTDTDRTLSNLNTNTNSTLGGGVNVSNQVLVSRVSMSVESDVSLF